MNRSKKIKVDQKVSDIQTKEKEWKPTPAMIVWLDTATEMQTDVISDISEACQITRDSWYRWLKDSQFEDWYWAEYDKRTRRWKPTVDAIGLKFARKGSAEHFKYLAQRVGNIKEEKEKNVVPVQINNFINKEKDEFGI